MQLNKRDCGGDISSEIKIEAMPGNRCLHDSEVTMTGKPAGRIVFATFMSHPSQLPQVALLVESIRTFAGSFAKSNIWVFHDSQWSDSLRSLKGNGIKTIPLELPQGKSSYPFIGKIAACARTEEMTAGLYRSLVWIAPDCLVLRSPDLFDLDDIADAAVRPVHVRNVGSPFGEPPDGYWNGVFRAAGITDLRERVESFVDCRVLRAYYNTHAFAVNPSRGLMRSWLSLFLKLTSDLKFQKKHCTEEAHRIFLHQVSLSTILASELERTRIRILPEEYCYPYNLHESVPEDRKARTLNELVCIAYENRSLNPEKMTDIIVEEPLRTWLS